MPKAFEINGIDLSGMISNEIEVCSGRIRYDAEGKLISKRVQAHAYGMRLRGYSPGAQPKNPNLVIEMNPGHEFSEKYYNIIGYFRKLSDDEVSAYDLDYLGIATF